MGAHQQRLGRVYGSIEEFGHVGNREVVQVAQRQHGAMLRRKLLQRCLRCDRVELDIPWVLVLWLLSRQCSEIAFLPSFASPVVDQFVACDADQPCRRGRRGMFAVDRVNRREERLRGELLGQAGTTAAREQVAVDIRQRGVVHGEQSRGEIFGCRRRLQAHTLPIARRPAFPTP